MNSVMADTFTYLNSGKNEQLVENLSASRTVRDELPGAKYEQVLEGSATIEGYVVAVALRMDSGGFDYELFFSETPPVPDVESEVDDRSLLYSEVRDSFSVTELA